MKGKASARISAKQYQLIQNLPSNESQAVLAAYFAIKFIQLENLEKESKESKINQVFQDEILIGSPVATKILKHLISRNWGGRRQNSGRKPRISANVQNLQSSAADDFENQVFQDEINQVFQDENQDNQDLDKKSGQKNQVFQDLASKESKTNQDNQDLPTRVVDNNIKNNIINNNPELKKENHSLTGMIKEKNQVFQDSKNKWDLAAAEWNRIAGLYKRPRVRRINPAIQKSIICRCKENHLSLREFLAICEKALRGDAAMRCGTDKWGGADLIYFSRPANFMRAMQIADNPEYSKMEHCNNSSAATAAVLAEFIKGDDSK